MSNINNGIKPKVDNRDFMVPNPGEVAVLCSQCGCPDFAVHVKPLGPHTARMTEVVCVKCRTQTKVEDGPVFDRRGKQVNGRFRRYIGGNNGNSS